MASAWGVGLATIAADGTTLDTFFRHLGLGSEVPANTPTETQSTTDENRGVAIMPTTLVIDTDAAPTSATDVYLRLHLLSHRICLPRTINLDGVIQQPVGQLDVTADTATLGKPAGSDLGLDKATYPKIFGLDGARQMALSLTSDAKAALSPYGEKASRLNELADYLLTRSH